MRQPQARAGGLLAVAFGLFSCCWPLSLPDAGAGVRGFALTTAGITAVFLAMAAGRAGHRVLAMLGIISGILGTLLCAWSLVAFHLPGEVPPVPSLSSLTTTTTSSLPTVAPPANAASPRIVPPIEGADIAAAPDGQLRANLRHVVFNLAAGLSYSQQQGALPAELLIAPDGTVHYANLTLSKVPPDMVLNYVRSADGRDFTLRVSDSVSGMAVSTDSTTRAVVNE